MTLRLIQISAWNDSGGGFLHRLFDGHPGLNVWPYELLLGSDTGFCDALTPGWFHGRYRWPRLHAMLAAGDGDTAFDAISDLELKSVLANGMDAKHNDFRIDLPLAQWRRDAVKAWLSGPDRSQRSFLVAYLSSFLRLRGQDPEARPLLGHCPVAILDAAELFADFPDASIVHVLRSPLAGFHDMRSRHPTLKVQQYAEKWSLVNMAAALCWAKHAEKVALVTLDALMTDRRATMERLTRFLGLSFDETILRPGWEGRPLSENDLGPFGGVRTPLTERERAAAEMIHGAERDELLRGTAATIAVLVRLGVAEAGAWLA
ncbi:MAG: sulfotransferase [Devosia sp.]|nr:sulfotransferase [Devosia sp.]